MTQSEREEVEEIILSAILAMEAVGQFFRDDQHRTVDMWRLPAMREFDNAVNRWRDKQDCQPSFTEYTKEEWRTEQ